MSPKDAGVRPRCLAQHLVIELCHSVHIERRVSHAPRTGQRPFIIVVVARKGFFVKRFVHALLHTGATKPEGELSPTPVRQDGLKQIPWWDGGTKSQTKVLGEIGGAGLIGELRMTDGIYSVLTYPQIQTGIGYIPYFLTDSNLVVKT